MPRRSPPRKKKSEPVSPAARIRALEEENRTLRELVSAIPPNRLLPLGDILQEFNTLDLDRIATVAVSKISALVGARLCSLFLYDYDCHELILARRTHARPLPERISLKLHPGSVMETSLSGRRTVAVQGFDAWTRAQGTPLERPFADHYETETCLTVPLLSAHFIVGLLNLADWRDDRPFDPESDVPVVEHLARVLSMALRNCRLFREVQNQAHTDGLTGLHNYRAFHETIRGEIHRSQRYGRPLGLLMIDLDSFKELNDRYGHQGGDVALADLGKVIRTTMRREDFCARTGGDEIAILLPETSPEAAAAVARRLLAAVRAHAFVFEGKRLPVTISIGVTSLRPDLPLTRFIGEADQALYRAKQEGKNRVEVAEIPG